MPELVGNNASFVSLLYLVQEILYFLYFKMASAAILDFEVKMVLKPSDRYFIGFVMPELAENDTLFVLLAQLLPEIHYFLYFKMVLAAILKICHNMAAILDFSWLTYFLK